MQVIYQECIDVFIGAELTAEQAKELLCKLRNITVAIEEKIEKNNSNEESNTMLDERQGKRLKAGDKFFVSRNAEFLNQAFGTNYKGWMRCGWKYAPDIIVWMVWLDGEVREGWLNTIIEEQRIVQEDYVGKPEEQLYSHRRITEFHRIVVKRDKGCYTILGLYKCVEATRYKRVWRKISDEI